MDILITGGAGFAGSHIAERLLKEGHNVTIFDNLSFGSNLTSEVELIEGDILDKDKLEKSTEGKDVVLHLAGLLGTSETIKTPIETTKINVIGTLNVLEASKKNSFKVVFSSKPIPSDWLNPYNITKNACDLYCKMYEREFGIKIVISKWFNLYGPREKAYPVQKFIPTFIEHALLNKPLPIFGDGEQTVDAIYIDDAVEAITRAMTREKAVGKIIEIGRGIPIKVNDVANLIIKLTNSKSTLNHLPMRPGEASGTKLAANTEAMKTYLDFIPTYDLESGLKLTIPYYKQKLINEKLLEE